jgi:aquaporin Z
MANNRSNFKLPWTLFLSELIGTALLVVVGLSFVILDFGQGSPVVALIPSPGVRRAITGFLFGSTGATIALSAVGKESGAHINPVVTLAFWLVGKMKGRIATGYVLAQLLGGVLGALPLIAWGQMGASVNYGASLPGNNYGDWLAVLGETVTTFALVVGLFIFLPNKKLRPFTPALFPFLYAIMVFLEAPISGTSTNPARSLGPQVVSGDWRGWWVYWVGPILGTVLGVLMYKYSWLKRLEVEVAKLYHFEHDPHGVFGGQPSSDE